MYKKIVLYFLIHNSTSIYLSISADRIRKFEDTGIIQGYTIKINEDALDFSIHCMIQIDIKNNKFEKFENSHINEPSARAITSTKS